MLPDIEQLRVTYKNLPENKLISLAVNEAASLRPEAFELVKAEIKSRGLEAEISKAMDVQLIEVNDNRFESYLSLIRSQPCPVCTSNAQPLNAALSGTVMSFILLTQYKKKLLIACPTYLHTANQDATVKTALLGWWGFPWGLIRTPQALVRNIKTAKKIKTGDATAELITFVKNNIVVIDTIKNNGQSLQFMLSGLNKR